MNLFTKKSATITGGIFTVVFFVIFTLSERKYGKQRRVLKTKEVADTAHPFPETAIERFRLQGAAIFRRSRWASGRAAAWWRCATRMCSWA